MNARPHAHLVVAPNPLMLLAKSEMRTIDAPCALHHLAPQTRQPFIILRNGQSVLRAQWCEPVMEGDLITVRMLPQDGGGGGSNPLKTVLLIAVAVFAPQVGAWVASSAWAAEAVMASSWLTQGMIATAASAAVGFGATALVNAMIPPTRPPSPNGGAQLNYASASPTYNLSAQGNMARLDGPIPIQYGRLRAFPDLAAKPYGEYAGNEQYLYQIFCLGVGEFDIEEIRIEDTPISSFEEITIEVVSPYETLDLFPAAVATSSEVAGQEALTNVTLGPFVANAATTTATRLAFDVVCPRGLYYANDSGGLDQKSITVRFEAQPIDDDGAPTGDWIVLGTETIADATTTPQRRSFSYGVTSPRWQTRATRLDTKDTSSRAGHEIAWTGLRAYLKSDQTFGNVTCVAVKARATNNLSAQASRLFNVVATRKLQTWDQVNGWSATTVPTRSAAWAAANACKSVGIPDEYIDLAGLHALDATLAARGDTFDARFDQVLTFWEALRKIGKAVRSMPYRQAGIVFMRRYEAATVPAQMFTMRNIIRGSFNMEFILPGEDSADAVEARYFDENGWTYRRVTGKVAGSPGAKPAKADYFGIVDREQAYREALHEAAVNARCRMLSSFQTEMEGMIPSYGDLVSVAHDLPAWGQSGEVVAWDAQTLTATLSEPLTWEAGQTHYIGLRRRAGSPSGPYVATPGAAPNQAVLDVDPEASDPDFSFYLGQKAERTHYAFGWGDTWSQLGRVLAIRPRGMDRVELLVMNEDPLPHTIDQGVNAPPVVSSQLASIPTRPVVSGLIARSLTDDPGTMLLSWQHAPGATHYLVEVSASGQSWTRVGEPTACNFTARALYGPETIVRVCAVGLTAGPWVQIQYGLTADYMWTGDADPMWTNDNDPMWSY